MIRLVLTGLLFMFSVAPANAQKEIDHTKLMNATWEAFGELMFKVKYKDGNSTYTPYFPPKLMALQSKRVKLSGYMITTKVGRKHDQFMLSVLPTEQCAFCGNNGIPPVVEVRMKNGKKLEYSERPIDITGTVYLNSKMDGAAEIQLLEATVNN